MYALCQNVANEIVDILVKETQDCEIFCKTGHDSADIDSSQFLSIIIDGKTWFGCRVCGKRCPQWNIFTDHYNRHILTSEISDREHFRASNTIQDDEHGDSTTQKLVDSKMNSAENFEQADFLKFEQLSSTKVSDAANMEERCEISGSSTECLDNADTKVCSGEITNRGSKKLARNSKKATKNMAPFQCMLCNRCFEDGEKLQTHLQKHGRKMPFKCSKCHETFDRSNTLKKHVTRKHPDVERPFACSVCNCQFPCTKALCEHLKLHPSPLGCSLCGTSCVRLDHLRHHIKTTHSDYRPYQCSYCGMTFKEQHHINEHNSRHVAKERHRGTPKSMKLQCKICCHWFTTQDKQKQHMLEKHSVGRWHECTICHQKYLFQVYLQQHMRKHEAEKPYGCTKCPRRFNSRFGLRAHLVLHSDERNFACGCCGRTFYRRSHLRSHFMIHLKQ